MSSTLQPPHRPPSAGRSPDDVDDLLRDFFRSQMPAPWPAPAGRASARRHAPVIVARTKLLRWSRFTLAAAVALLVIGYWSLASRFPVRPADPGASINASPELGAKDRLRGKAVERTRNGREAVLQWEQSPDGLFMRIEEKSPPMR